MLERLLRDVSQRGLRFLLNLIDVIKLSTFQSAFHVWKEAEVPEGEVGL